LDRLLLSMTTVLGHSQCILKYADDFCLLVHENNNVSAKEEIIIQLLKTKCLPILYYGIDVCPISRVQARSLGYAVHSCIKKFFSTTDQSVVEQCMIHFEYHHVHETIRERKRK